MVTKPPHQPDFHVDMIRQWKWIQNHPTNQLVIFISLGIYWSFQFVDICIYAVREPTFHKFAYTTPNISPASLIFLQTKWRFTKPICVHPHLIPYTFISWFLSFSFAYSVCNPPLQPLLPQMRLIVSLCSNSKNLYLRIPITYWAHGMTLCTSATG